PSARLDITDQGDEAVPGEGVQDRLKTDRIVARTELCDRLLAPRVGSALTELDQSEKNAPRDLDLTRILDLAPHQAPCGMAGDGNLGSGALQTIMISIVSPASQDERLVGVQRKDSPLELLPELDQNLLDQRQDSQRSCLDRIRDEPFD